MPNEKIPLSEAASRLQSTPLNVLMHIKRGMLTGEERDGSWVVDADSLDAFLAQEEGPVRQSVCASGYAHKCPSCG